MRSLVGHAPSCQRSRGLWWHAFTEGASPGPERVRARAETHVLFVGLSVCRFCRGGHFPPQCTGALVAPALGPCFPRPAGCVGYHACSVVGCGGALPRASIFQALKARAFWRAFTVGCFLWPASCIVQSRESDSIRLFLFGTHLKSFGFL